MRLIGDLITLAIVLVVLAVGGLLWLERVADRPGPLAENALVEIPAGSKLREIAGTLEERGVVDSARLFELLARWRMLWRPGAGAPQAGEFDMPAGVSLGAALKRLAEGQPAVRRITVREGLASAEIVSLLAETGDLTGDIAEIPAEGTLMPDTYHYEKGNSRARILAMMQSEAAEALERLWPARAPNLPFDTPEEAVVLASIVEKETGLAGERAEVAGVFVNRLRKGMRLQSDPTVIYAIVRDNGPLGRPLRRSDLEYDSPYNTYRHAGLPPGPIANPGRAALEAALNPMETEHLYFVADGTGGHAFARTLDEHNRNVARWRQVQRARGE